MRAVGNHRGARPISLALVAGLVAFEAVLALGTGAVGIPGVAPLPLSGGGGGGGAAGAVSPAAGEPRLDGLAEIPLKEWDRDEAESAEPQAFGENSKTREVLPWDAVEPGPFTAATPAAAPAPSPAPEPPQATPAPPLLP